MEVWVTPLDKELRLAEVLREGMGNRKGRKEEDTDFNHYKLQVQV